MAHRDALLDPITKYERAAGEVEARNVQKRMNMTPEERRTTPPWETQDVLDTQQILRMYGEGPQMSQSLPMDEASRLARAREMGFDTERPMYHGSKAEFDSFLPSDRGALGPGVYLTQHAGIARNYGPNVGEFYAAGNILNTGPFKPIPDGLAERAKALLSPDEAARWNRLWPTPRDMGGYTIGNADAEVFREVLTRSVEPKRVPEIMKKLGYDGMEGVADGHEMVVFDPSKIRSTRAVFDPAKKDSGNLLASSAPTDPLTTQTILRQYGKDED